MIRTLTLTLGLLAAALPAAADKLPLDALSRYFNQMQTASAAFTQINNDGTIDTGRIMIKRPGRMRFEYDNGALVLANHGTVAIYDPKGNSAPETYPLKRTPLSIILAKRVDLKQANMVVGHSADDTSTTVTAQDPKHPEYGNIQLRFTGPNPELRQWIINDDSGGSTTVILGALKVGAPLKNRLFDIQGENAKRDPSSSQ